MSPFAGEAEPRDVRRRRARHRDRRHPGDAEAALVAYESELFPRSAASAGEWAESLDIVLRDDSPYGPVELFKSFGERVPARHSARCRSPWSRERVSARPSPCSSPAPGPVPRARRWTLGARARASPTSQAPPKPPNPRQRRHQRPLPLTLEVPGVDVLLDQPRRAGGADADQLASERTDGLRFGDRQTAEDLEGLKVMRCGP